MYIKLFFLIINFTFSQQYIYLANVSGSLFVQGWEVGLSVTKFGIAVAMYHGNRKVSQDMVHWW